MIPTLVPVASDGDDSPDGAVKRGDTENIPFGRDPTPKCGIAVGSIAVFVLEENVDESGDEGDAVAAQQIWYLHSPQLSRVILVVKCQIDVERHGQCPECICRHEPVYSY